MVILQTKVFIPTCKLLTVEFGLDGLSTVAAPKDVQAPIPPPALFAESAIAAEAQAC